MPHTFTGKLQLTSRCIWHIRLLSSWETDRWWIQKSRCSTQSIGCRAGFFLVKTQDYWSQPQSWKQIKKTKGGVARSRRAFVLKIVSSFTLQNTHALQAPQSVDFLDSRSNFWIFVKKCNAMHSGVIFKKNSQRDAPLVLLSWNGIYMPVTNWIREDEFSECVIHNLRSRNADYFNISKLFLKELVFVLICTHERHLNVN